MAAPAYTVTLSELADKKIKYWVKKSSIEVSGFGKVTFDKVKKEFYVSDVWLVKQSGGAAHTDIDAAALGKLLFLTKDIEGDLNFWWHSHVNMDVFWSGTDKATIMNLGSNGWCVASVFNKREEVRTAISYVATSALNDNKPETVMQDEVQTFIETTAMDEDLKNALDKQYDDNVETYRSNYASSGWQGSWGNWEGWEAPSRTHHESTVDAIATRNIIDATDSCPLTDNELEDACAIGLRGFGYDVEAEALGLSKETYMSILKRNNLAQLGRLEDRLIELEEDGELDKILYSLDPEKAEQFKKGNRNARS